MAAWAKNLHRIVVMIIIIIMIVAGTAVVSRQGGKQVNKNYMHRNTDRLLVWHDKYEYFRCLSYHQN